MMTDIHQADVAATENHQASTVEKLRALASRLNEIADHAETGSKAVLDAFFGEGVAQAKKPTQEQSLAAAREAIRNAGL